MLDGFLIQMQLGKLVFHEFFSSLKSWMVVDGENLVYDVTCQLDCIFFCEVQLSCRTLQYIQIHES